MHGECWHKALGVEHIFYIKKCIVTRVCVYVEYTLHTVYLSFKKMLIMVDGRAETVTVRSRNLFTLFQSMHYHVGYAKKMYL